MDNLTVAQERELLCQQLRASLSKIAVKTEDYINSFPKEDFFVFSDSENRIKGYKNKYLKFSTQIADELLITDRLMGKASSLLISADRAMDYDSLHILQALFEGYISFKKNSSKYFSKTEKALSSQAVSVSSLVDGAKNFKISVTELMNKAK